MGSILESMRNINQLGARGSPQSLLLLEYNYYFFIKLLCYYYIIIVNTPLLNLRNINPPKSHNPLSPTI
jgi:hypothetical protein